MTERRLAPALAALQAERITFRAFYRETRLDWSRMATALHRNWHLPPTVTIDDVEQELLLGAWQSVGRWSPTAGMTLVGYVVWVAHNHATRWIHRQRQCDTHTRRGESRYAWCCSSIGKDAEASARILENYASGAAPVDEQHDYATMLRDLPEVSTSLAGRAALRALIDAEGDTE